MGYRLINVILVLLCLGACAPGHNDYSRFENLPVQGWVYGDDIVFVTDSVVPAPAQALGVVLRHNNEYPYSNLWLEISYRRNGIIHRDTVDIELADRYGRWHGSGFGTLYQIKRSVNGQMTLRGNDTIAVRHIMRVDTLRGLEQVGITLTPAKK